MLFHFLATLGPWDFALVLALLATKSLLGGFLTMFPIMGMISAYEARASLYTLCRQVPILMLLFIPMFITILLAQQFLPLPASLLLGWLAYLAFLLPTLGATKTTWQPLRHWLSKMLASSRPSRFFEKR